MRGSPGSEIPAALGPPTRPPRPDPLFAMPDIAALDGEDRSFGGKTLYVDLVPKSSWFTNVRSCVSRAEWDRLRRFVYRRAEMRCEICDVAGVRLDCHERWSYDRATQRLERLIALCTRCHSATHYGLAKVRGFGEVAFEHLRAVNGWSASETEAHIVSAFALWNERGRVDWTLDLTILTNFLGRLL